MPRTVVSGNIIVDQWTVRDGNNDPLTGMLVPGDVTLTLLRQSAGVMVAASETVSWAEIGATGQYYLSFTPLNTGYYRLNLREIDPASQLRTWPFEYDVFASGAAFAASYSNAFCSEADIERWLQQAISASSAPSDTQAAAFAEARAALLMSLCARYGFTATPGAVTGRIEDMLRESNAIGAAMDYTIAQSFGSQPTRTERAEVLLGLWNGYFGYDNSTGHILGTLEYELRGNLASLATNHILSGDTAAATVGAAPTDEGMQTTMGSLY